MSFIIVIFGASGDLTKRKLMPALYSLRKDKRIHDDFLILGVGRTEYSDDSFQEYISGELKRFVSVDEQEAGAMKGFVSRLHYLSMDPSNGEDYVGLSARLDQLNGEGHWDEVVYYLATPPSLYGVIPQHLKKYHLNGKLTRIIVEKPFGYDLKSAIALNRIYDSVFTEQQIYRIDHFLGKETAQNILAFRFANTIFEPVWNRNYIDFIEITAVEDIGIEERGGYYDASGALRDMVQNHLIQLVALTAMEPPVAFNATDFRNEVLKVYNSLSPLTRDDLTKHVIRGQYLASDKGKAYREEKNVAPGSRTETYIAMRLGIGNWRWSGVPFYIRTGKQMPEKATEIVVHFKTEPHQMFRSLDGICQRGNTLIIRIQPDEGIILRVGMKVPGSGFEVRQTDLDFSYDKLGGIPAGDPYARLIEDCISGDQTLFTRDDAVEASWRFFDPIIRYWEKTKSAPLYGYPAGTWGPLKKLTNNNLYCNL